MYFVYMVNTIIFNDSANRHHYISAYRYTEAVSEKQAISQVVWSDMQEHEKTGYPRRFWRDTSPLADNGDRTTEIKTLETSISNRAADEKELKYAIDHYTVLKERWVEIDLETYIKEVEAAEQQKKKNK